MNQSNETGPFFSILLRINPTSAGFPFQVFNVQPAYAESFGVASAQLRRAAHWALAVEHWAFAL
jgi:hypothetical protein